MIRNFVAGTLWGVVVAGIGLAVVSQVAPMPNVLTGVGADGKANTDTATMPAKPLAALPDVAPSAMQIVDAAPAEPRVPLPASDDVAKASLPDGAAVAPAKPSAPLPKALDPAVTADAKMPAPVEPKVPELPTEGASDDQLALGDAADVPAAKPALPNVADDAPLALETPQSVSIEPVPGTAADPELRLTKAPEVPAADQTDAIPETDVAPPLAPEALLDPAPQIKANPAPASIAPDDPAAAPQTTEDLPLNKGVIPDPAPKPDLSVLQPVAPPEPAPSLIAKDQPSTFAPDTAVTSAAEGVTTGRLPRIGDATAQTTEPASPDVDMRPVQQFSQDFENPSGKPLFAILLRDTGGADIDRATLAALPFPVSFVIDPLAANAAEASAIYRAAGQEVIMLASGIPAGAQPSDLEQTFQSLGAVLPQAVAVIDLATAGFQDDRPLASLVVPIVNAQGRGLITFDRGLNAADQVARRIDVPAATIFRQLDGAGEDLPLIRRYLDRAAFKAAQDGRVVVLGDTRPETIAALMEWTVEGRASSVTLAPVTAVLSVD